MSGQSPAHLLPAQGRNTSSQRGVEGVLVNVLGCNPYILSLWQHQREKNVAGSVTKLIPPIKVGAESTAESPW